MLSVAGINLRAQKGHSLIELLAAIALSSAGALGNFHLQSLNNVYEQNLLSSARAELAVRNLMRMMDANPEGLSAYRISFDSAPADTEDCRRRACRPRQLAGFHIAQWKCQLGGWLSHSACRRTGPGLALLPQGDGQLQGLGSGVAIMLRWRPPGSQERNWRQLERHHLPLPAL